MKGSQIKTPTALTISSAKELLNSYLIYRKEEARNKMKADKLKSNIIRMLSKIPYSEAQLYNEKINSIITKL